MTGFVWSITKESRELLICSVALVSHLHIFPEVFSLIHQRIFCVVVLL